MTARQLLSDQPYSQPINTDQLIVNSGFSTAQNATAYSQAPVIVPQSSGQPTYGPTNPAAHPTYPPQSSAQQQPYGIAHPAACLSYPPRYSTANPTYLSPYPAEQTTFSPCHPTPQPTYPAENTSHPHNELIPEATKKSSGPVGNIAEYGQSQHTVLVNQERQSGRQPFGGSLHGRRSRGGPSTSYQPLYYPQPAPKRNPEQHDAAVEKNDDHQDDEFD